MTRTDFDQVLEFPDRFEYSRRGRFHRLNEPAVEFKDGSEEWYLNGNRSRETTTGFPEAAVIRKIAGEIVLKQWWLKGILTRDISDGPAIERKNGTIVRNSQDVITGFIDEGSTREWRVNGKRHNVGNPAFVVIRKDPETNAEQLINEQWWTDGLLNRVGDEPAIFRITNESSNKDWLNNRGQLTDPVELSPWPPLPGAPIPEFERPDEFVDFDQKTVTIREWWVNGVRHRANGPALTITNEDGFIIRQECWINGKLSGAFLKPDTNWIDVIVSNGSSTTTRVSIPISDYKTTTSFTTALANSLNEGIPGKNFTVSFSNVTGLITFSYTGEGEVTFRFSNDPEQSLSKNLGFPVDEVFEYPFVDKTLTAPLEFYFEPLPAVKIFEGFDKNEKPIYSMEWWLNGLRDREDEPAIIQFVNNPPDENQRYERLFNYYWYENDILHRRDDLPAIELSNGTKEWYIEGIRTRDTGPAVIRFISNDKNGSPLFDQFWYTNDRFNRGDDLPAVMTYGGNQQVKITASYSRIGNTITLSFFHEHNIFPGTLINISNLTDEMVTKLYTVESVPTSLTLVVSETHPGPLVGTIVVNSPGCKEWWIEGIRTRVGGPAILKSNQSKAELMFMELDFDEDGFIKLVDLKKAYNFLSESEIEALSKVEGFEESYQFLSEAEIEMIFANLDENGDGKISLDEFLEVVQPPDSEYWYFQGELNRGDDEPAVIEYVETTLDPIEGPIYSFDYYWYNRIKITTTGIFPVDCQRELQRRIAEPILYPVGPSGIPDFFKGLLNRSGDKPAVINSKGDESWYTNGLLNRLDGKPAIERSNGDREWWTNGVNTRDILPAIIYGDGKEVYITDQPILTKLIITEPKDISLTVEFIKEVLPRSILITNIDNYSQESVIFNESILRSIFNKYGTILSIDYQGTSATITYSFLSEALVAIAEENNEVYGELALTVIELEEGTYTSVTKSGRNFTVTLVNLERTEISSLVTRIIGELSITSRVEGRKIFFTEPKRIVYPQTLIEDLFAAYLGLTITKSNRIYTIEFPTSTFSTKDVNDAYRTVISSNIQDISTRVRTAQNGQSFRSGEPAIVTPNSQIWLVDGKIERDGDPAIIFSNGDQLWYEAGELNRTDGPAVEKSNGDKEWFIRGQRTRSDGPAVELADGSEEWWTNGQQRRVDDYPIGTIIDLPFFIEEYPINWLKCDGSNVSRTVYQQLFDVIGTTIGEGDGSTTFTLPMLSDKGIKFENISINDLPSKKAFSRFINQLHLWIKTFPFPKFKGALKRSITNNGKITGQIVWETESYEEGTYYYVEQVNSSNNGIIRLFPPGEDPEDRIFNVTVSENNRFRLEGTALNGDPILAITPTIEVRRGDRLILNLNYLEPVYDYIWAVDGKPSREGGRNAIVRWNGDQEWYINGTLNRINDQPAIIRANGDQEWYINGTLNRINDQPAIIRANGDQEWYLNGFLHRRNNLPAIVKADGTLLYYICGRQVTLENYLEVLLQHDDFCNLIV
jgi:hypothetical protein